MNYSYKFIDHNYILSMEEHEICQRELGAGRPIVRLRGGTLGLNMAMIKSWSKTDQLTDEQESSRFRTPSLPKPKSLRTKEGLQSFKESSCKFRTKMGWGDHPKYCICHHILIAPQTNS